MADKSNMSVEEILAACRRADGGGGGEGTTPSVPSASAPEPASASEPESAAPKKPAPTKPAPKPAAAPGAGKKPGQMSMEEMLAAARGQTSGGDKAAPAAKAGPAAKAAPASPPAPSGGKSGTKPGTMSMDEMLAAARANKAGGAAQQQADAGRPAPAPKAAPKPAPKAAEKAASKEKAPVQEAAKAAGPRDTASILTEARKGDKRGPMTKAEAAAAGKDVPEKAAKVKLSVPPMPERPAYARAPAAAAQPTEVRRGFLAQMVSVCLGSALAVGFTTIGLTNLLWGLGLARFMFPNILTEPPTRFKVGFPDDFAPGQVQTKFIAQFGVWIVRYEYESQPQIFAIQSVCTHLGCTPNWLEGEQKFKCPCHGSGFYKDGINFEGPAPRPLERFAIRLADDGQLEVDKSRRFQQELGQWQDTASFVPV